MSAAVLLSCRAGGSLNCPSILGEEKEMSRRRSTWQGQARRWSYREEKRTRSWPERFWDES